MCRLSQTTFSLFKNSATLPAVVCQNLMVSNSIDTEIKETISCLFYSCGDCVSSHHSCTWCINDHKCTANTSDCPNSNSDTMVG